MGIDEGERVEIGNERGKTIVKARPRKGQQRGVVMVEGIWPNRNFETGIGINALTSADPGWPNGGAVFHDTAVWIRIGGVSEGFQPAPNPSVAQAQAPRIEGRGHVLVDRQREGWLGQVDHGAAHRRRR